MLECCKVLNKLVLAPLHICLPAVDALPVTVFVATTKAMNRSATSKYQQFIAERMGFKEVTELPGIRGVLGERLSRAGYDKVSIVYTMYY